MLGGPESTVSFTSDLCISKHVSSKWAEVILPFAQDKFDQMALTYENTKKFLKQLLQNLADWTIRLQNK